MQFLNLLIPNTKLSHMKAHTLAKNETVIKMLLSVKCTKTHTDFNDKFQKCRNLYK